MSLGSSVMCCPIYTRNIAKSEMATCCHHPYVFAQASHRLDVPFLAYLKNNMFLLTCGCIRKSLCHRRAGHTPSQVFASHAAATRID